MPQIENKFQVNEIEKKNVSFFEHKKELSFSVSVKLQAIEAQIEASRRAREKTIDK